MEHVRRHSRICIMAAARVRRQDEILKLHLQMKMNQSLQMRNWQWQIRISQTRANRNVQYAHEYVCEYREKVIQNSRRQLFYSSHT